MDCIQWGAAPEIESMMAIIGEADDSPLQRALQPEGKVVVLGLMNPFLALNMPNGLELFILFGLVLILFGAKKLPELARGLGQAMNEFRKAKDDFNKELETANPNAVQPQPNPAAQPHVNSPTPAAPPAPVSATPPNNSTL